MKTKWLAAMLCILLCGSVVARAADDLDGHWAKEYISYLKEENIYRPSASTGKYDPDREMTRAEFMRYLNRAFHFTETASITYTDVSADAWYYETIQIAEKYGYINGVGNNQMSPESLITREQAATVLGRLMKTEPASIAPADLKYNDRASISDWSAGYIEAAAQKGILSGYTDGTFRPKASIRRAEAAKILYYYLGSMLSVQGKAYSGSNLKSDTENVTISESCTLSDAKIKGDLYISEGLGADAVTLNNVTVEGKLIVTGGTVMLVNTTASEMVLSSSMGRLLQVTALGSTEIEKTTVTSTASITAHNADTQAFPLIETTGSNRVSLSLDAAVDTLRLNAESTVSTSDSTSIYALTAAHPASITGYGTIYQAQINSLGVSVANSVEIASYQLASGIHAMIGGYVVETSNKTTLVPDHLYFDLANRESLTKAVSVALPAGAKLTGMSFLGKALTEMVDYETKTTGFLLLPKWLSTLTPGEYTLSLQTDTQGVLSLPLTVENTAVLKDAIALTFDRYYRAASFRDISISLPEVAGQTEIVSVVLGMESLPYLYDKGMQALVLRRSVLAGLRAGQYTVTVDLSNGTSKLLHLTVVDSAPEHTLYTVVAYRSDTPTEPSIVLPTSTVKSVVEGKGNTILQPNTDYQVSGNTFILKVSALEAFKQRSGYVEYTIVLENTQSYVLVVDYI